MKDVQTAGAFDSTESHDPWPGGAAARDSQFTALMSLVSSGRYAQAQDEARTLATQPYATEWADSLRGLADLAEEEAMYERAQALPGSNLEGNRDAYGELAAMYPSSPRSGLYVEKRDAYAQRVVDRDNARLQARTRARSRPRARTTPCCKRCSAGKPCGNSCISRSYTCHQPPGCAC